MIKASGLDYTANRINGRLYNLQHKVSDFISELTQVGLIKASTEFGVAQYDGTNDVQCSKAVQGNTGYVEARGSSVAFIEFGTGVTYASPAESHPMEAQFGLYRGTYGHHLGLMRFWRYPISHGLGTNGWTDASHPGYAATMGNPANRCMLYADGEMRSQMRRIWDKVMYV